MTTTTPQGADHFAEMLEATGPNRGDENARAGSRAVLNTVWGDSVEFEQTIEDGEPLVIITSYQDGHEPLEIRHEDFERVLIEMRAWWPNLRRILASEDWSQQDAPPVAVLQQGESE